VWAFDVDGSVVDSLTGTSLRPYVRELLTALRGGAVTVIWWSAGGAEHARARARSLGVDQLVNGYYTKQNRDTEGRWTLAHLPPAHVPDVVVDDRPEEAPPGVRVIGVRPYIAPDPYDQGLRGVLDTVHAGTAGDSMLEGPML
jgi:hypothetical protein